MPAQPETWSIPAEIVISCARGLAPFARLEAERLGYTVLSVSDTAVGVRGTLRDTMRLNLWLRTAHRVLWPVATARAMNLDHLFRHASDVPWERWLDPDGYFTVNCVVRNDSIRDTRMPSLRVKDAIADRMRSAFGRRPNSGSEFTGAAVFALWRDADLRLYLDTTGEPLSRRGYRLLPGKAPMQETLAAACVMATEWDGSTPFVAPMCGSGTPAIEAALIACRRAPGILRERFAFMALTGYDGVQAEWDGLREAARRGETHAGLPPIVATDLDADAVRIARENARAAGVEELITFGVCDFAATPVPVGPGVVFMNPEYGERLGRGSNLPELYARMGEFLKQRCGPAYRGYVLVADKALATSIGLRSGRRIPFFNGPIECRLLEFSIREPGSPDYSAKM